ncbi:MAG TPA: tetratricopeptide repeat protein [Rubrivivax sp.]
MRTIIALLVALLMQGCATTAPVAPGAHAVLHDEAFGAPVAVPSAGDVFALNAAMQDYLRTAAAPLLRQRGPQSGLVDALYSKQQLKLEYESEKTLTAAEAFDARAGNCLSLVIMTAAFAKELGLRVRFQVVESPDVWDRSGGLVFKIGHVNVALGGSASTLRSHNEWSNWLTVDFMPPPVKSPVHSWAIDEGRVVAMYMNNRAAETLALGQAEAAYWWARAAVLQDATFAEAFNTLGVVYQRHGRPTWAEDALRRALALQPDNPQTLGNLADVLASLGRTAEAGEVSARLKRLQPHAPFAYLAQGLRALREGRFKEARDLLKKEVPLANDHHEVHFGLALAYWHLGDSEAAASHLRKARENSLTRQQQGLYAAKLAALRAHPTPP